MTSLSRHLIAALITLILSFSVSQSQAQVNVEIRNRVASDTLLKGFYEGRNYNPVWNAANLQGLSAFIRSLDGHGLGPHLFSLNEWEPIWQYLPPDPGAQADIDTKTTHLALYAIQSLAYGFVDPATVHPKWKDVPREIAASDFLNAALQQPPHTFANFLLSKVPPQDSRYADMVNTLQRYRKIQSFGGWKPLPNPGQAMGPGMSYRDLDLLKARLQAEGDLPETAQKRNRKNIFEQLTSDALKSFQFRHGIEVDGWVGPSTLRELNHSTQDRINTLIINLDRLRWMPRAFEQAEYVEVNIAEGALRVYNKRRRLTTMEVVVGVKGKHQTPVFHGNMKYMIFRPYWNVPPKIAREELVPSALKGDPAAYFSKNFYEIVWGYGAKPDATLPVNAENLQKVSEQKAYMRQKAGTHNAMGLVKFIFPNDNSVYLHDTSDENKKLFQAADRDFSHGCVRVSRPDELANIILQRNREGWNIGSVGNAMNDVSNPDNKVDLATPLPVYLMYWTAFIMGDGRVRFDQDIYGHDTVMKQYFRMQ